MLFKIAAVMFVLDDYALLCFGVLRLEMMEWSKIGFFRLAVRAGAEL